MTVSTILAFDSSGAHVSGAVLRSGTLTSRTEAMGRGQAERLIPFLEELLFRAGAGWADMDLIAVGTGPGNFTGTRIAVAAARGLALGRGIRATGVSGFEAALGVTPGQVLVTLEAPRGQLLVQVFADGVAIAPPRQIDPACPPGDLPKLPVLGHRAAEIGRALGTAEMQVPPEDPAARIVRVAARRLAEGRLDDRRPAPVYLRPADAAPPSDPPPVILP